MARSRTFATMRDGRSGVLLTRNHACLAETLAIVQANYDAMPHACKGHFTIGDDGKPIQLRTPDESKRTLAELHSQGRSP
jgi:hypothetical protein